MLTQAADQPSATCRLIGLKMAHVIHEHQDEDLASLSAAAAVAKPSSLLRRPRGKPAYMSVEVANGTVTDRLAEDVWSLGICLYAMLTGRLLYTSPGDSAFALLSAGGADRLLACLLPIIIYISHQLPPTLCALCFVQCPPRDQHWKRFGTSHG